MSTMYQVKVNDEVRAYEEGTSFVFSSTTVRKHQIFNIFMNTRLSLDVKRQSFLNFVKR